MNRRRPDLQMIDVSASPTVDYTGLDQSTWNRFEMRQLVVLRNIDRESIRQIEKSTGVNRRQLYRWLERAQVQHPDGRVFGFRALVGYMRIAEYERVRDVQVTAKVAVAAPLAPWRNSSTAIRRLEDGCFFRLNVAEYCLNRYIPTVIYEPAYVV
jgi:hypothetical protein